MELEQRYIVFKISKVSGDFIGDLADLCDKHNVTAFRDGNAAVEPAQAQDEREAFEVACLAAGLVRPGNYSPDFDRYVSERVQGRYEGFKLGRADHLAALSAVMAERDGLAAARMAYANEFTPDENGDPDVGNVHANIRALKAERDGEAERCEQWRNLALQFDRHRMSALAHLKMVATDQVGAIDACRDFLSKPPMSGHEINEEINLLRAEVNSLCAVL